jgi:hypothetical protein
VVGRPFDRRNPRLLPVGIAVVPMSHVMLLLNVRMKVDVRSRFMVLRRRQITADVRVHAAQPGVGEQRQHENGD